MSWLSSFFSALIVALVCGAGSVWLSLHAVRWHQVSNFEGAAGFAVMGLSLLGAMAGFLIGLIMARVAVAFGWAGFGGQLLWSLGTGLGVLALVAVVARVTADVPPTIRNRPLDLAIEARFPPEQIEQPVFAEDEASLELGVLHAGKPVMRKRVGGSLEFDQARQEEGRWIVPGRVELFTSTGRRILLIALRDKSEGFLVPLSGRSLSTDGDWSGWLPEVPAPENDQSLRLSYRFRVEESED